MKMIDSIGERLLVRPVVAAGLLSVSRAMIYQMLKEGRLPSVRVGDRAIRIPVSALRKFAAVESAESSGDEAA
jgi:excisionase family DNA binding protein